MDQIWTILIVIAGVFIIAVLWIVAIKRERGFHERLHEMSTDQLREMAQKYPLHCNKFLEELSRRNEDISFALPLLFTLTIKNNKATQLIGWTGLKAYFKDKLWNLDFSKGLPTKEDIDWIKSELNYMETQ